MSALFEQITAFFVRVTAAWKTNDGPAVAGTFTDDGTLINPFGQRAEGRAAVAAMYSEYFGGMLRGTSTTITLTHVHAVENDHAFADGDQTIYGSDGKVVLAVHISALLRRDGDGWRFVDSRPFPFATKPG